MLRQPIRSERLSFCFRRKLWGYFPSFLIPFHGGENENYIVFPRWFLFNNKILSRDFIHEPSLVVDSSPAFHYLHDLHQSSRLGTFNLKFQIFLSQDATKTPFSQYFADQWQTETGGCPFFFQLPSSCPSLFRIKTAGLATIVGLTMHVF